MKPSIIEEYSIRDILLAIEANKDPELLSELVHENSKSLEILFDEDKLNSSINYINNMTGY